MEISVIIPTYNEELSIAKTLEALSRLVNVSEVIVVDGGSSDLTAKFVKNYTQVKNLQLVQMDEPNRGKQLHEGTKHAKGDIFWFVYAETRPQQGCGRQIKGVMKYREVVGGNFEVIFSGETRWAKFMTWLYPHLRSWGLNYGDSAFFIGRKAYEKVGGFKPIGAFEDLDMFHRLRKIGTFYHLSQTVTTSSKRFEKGSFLWTFAKWSFFQVLYWFKFPPEKLAKKFLSAR
ncbi:MAG: glycosyltransferase family 2 protein [Pyrinomonadaceae bacterium]|nr:glycosyltransferase family 2 protein [Pyrinomonadaceae bacterium]